MIFNRESQSVPVEASPLVQAAKNDPGSDDDVNDNILSKKKKKASLEDYEIPNINLGEGAYGHVFLATNKKSGIKVAIKQVEIMKICELEKEENVLREKDIVNELKHNNIVRLLETFKVSEILN